MGEFDFKFDMIFADPPYFLSNGGISVQSGKKWCAWTKENGIRAVRRNISTNSTRSGFRACREHLKEDGTIWVSGTYHNIFSVANKLTQLGFKILNVITWAKTNPPPNISCRYFTYSTEFVIWARKEKKVPHYYNYQLMKKLNDDKQMTDVWRLPAIARWEKSQGKHPTQKPLALLLASSWLPPNRELGFLTHSPAAVPPASLPICWPPLPGHRPGKAVSGTEQGKKRGTGIADDSPRLPAPHQGYRGDGENGAAGRYASPLHSRGRNAGLRLAILRGDASFL